MGYDSNKAPNEGKKEEELESMLESISSRDQLFSKLFQVFPMLEWREQTILASKINEILSSFSDLPEENSEKLREDTNALSKKELQNRELELFTQAPKDNEEKYLLWHNTGKKVINETKAEELRKENEERKLGIFVDSDGAVYFKGEEVEELKKTPILRQFLLYFLKNKGVGGSYRELYVGVWKNGKVGLNFKTEDWFEDNVKRMKHRLNKLTLFQGLGEIAYTYGKYRLPSDLKFCVIEVLSHNKIFSDDR